MKRLHLSAIPYAALLFLPLLGIAGCAQTPTGDDLSSTSIAESSAASPSESASPSVPVAETATENDPDDGVARDEPVATPSTPAADGRIVVDVVLTRWGTNGPFSVGGYVPGIVESGGTCTATLTRDDVKIVATGNGTANASATDCGDGLAFNDSRLTGSGWQLVLSYTSDAYIGSSTSQEVSFE